MWGERQLVRQNSFAHENVVESPFAEQNPALCCILRSRATPKNSGHPRFGNTAHRPLHCAKPACG
jgi:hypothetical protein